MVVFLLSVSVPARQVVGLEVFGVLEYRLRQSWGEAKAQMARRYPQYKKQIDSMKRPSVEFRKGVFCDPFLQKTVYGSSVLGREPEVIIGLVRDFWVNEDTLIHEFKHSISFRLPLSDRLLAICTSWIDSEDSLHQLTPKLATTRSSKSSRRKRSPKP
jgi:hypothetical protein